MWYKYKGQLVDLSLAIELQETQEVKMPYKIVFFERTSEYLKYPRFVFWFENKEEAEKELIKLYKRLPK